MRLKLNRTLRAALIAAITAVGFTLSQAQAETNTNHIDTEDSSLISWFSFAENNEVTAGTKTTGWNNLLTFNEGGYGTTGSGHNMNGSDSNTKGDSFTLSFDINAMEAGTLLHMRTENSSGAWRNMKLTSTAEEKLSLTFLGDNRHTDIDLSSAPDWATVTITETGANLLVYVNGVKQGSIDMTGATNWIGKGLGFNFGSDFGGTANVQTAALKNILVYSRALTSTEVMALTSEEEFGTYTWVGSDSTNEWSSSAPCWTKEDSQVPVAFTNGNDALFNSTGAAHATLSVAGDIVAGTVTVDSATYTFNIGADASITAGKLAITGTGAKLTVNGVGRTMTVDALANDGELVIGEGASVKASATSISLSGSKTFKVSGNGTLTIQKLTVSGGEHTLGAGVNMTEIGLNGGTLIFANGTSTVSGKLISESDNSTLVIGTDNSTAVLKVGRLENGNINNGAKHSDITINSGSTLKITGNNTSTDYKQGSLILGEWNVTPTTVDVKGQLLADQVAATAGDSGYVMNINGGTALLKGLQRKSGDRKQEINISNGGKLILGSTGIQGSNTGSNVTLSVNGGTIGVFANSVTIDKNIALSGNVTFDTQMYTLDDIELTRGETGGTLTVSGNITGTGTITKTGNGTLVLSGTANTLGHIITLNGGELKLAGAFALDALHLDGGSEYVGDEGKTIAVGSGFLHSYGSIDVVNKQNGTLTVDPSATFTYNRQTATLDAATGKATLGDSTDYTTLYVNNGATVSYTAAQTIADTTPVTGVVLSNGTTVNMDAAATVGVTLAEGASATVNATAATTLNAVSGLAAAEKLIISGTETVTMGTNFAGGKVVVDNGHLNLGERTHTLSELTVTNGTVDVAGVDSKYGCISGTITIGEAGTFTTTGHHDVFGYHKDTATAKIVMHGAENKLAQLVLNSPNANSVTMTTNIEMQGYSAITSTKGSSDKGFNTYGGTITVAGVENSIDVLDMRDNGVTITVNPSGELEIKKVTVFVNQHGANTILVKAGEGTLTLSGASNLSDGLTINAGAVNVSGETTIGNLAGAGDLVVKDGGSLNVTGTVTDTTITVEDGGTIAGGVDAKEVGIAAHGTATFTQGIEESGISIQNWDNSGATVTNNGDTTEKYAGLQDSTMTVTADCLYSEAETDVTVKNKVVVGDIANIGEGNLTLTHVDVKPLEGVYARDGALTLQNITEVSLVEMEIASGSTVAVYSENADVEGTVTITEKLKAGGGTLLANLEMANGSKLALSLEGGGMQALTLGSQFTIAEGALVRLDDATLAALDNLAVGGSLTLIKALDQTTLGYGQDYAGTWYDAMFSRVDKEYSLAGDFQVFANETGFGLTKVSNVPEPTTGTLSLLALAALAARRRKHN